MCEKLCSYMLAMGHIQDAGRAGQTSPFAGRLVKHSIRRRGLVKPWSVCRGPSLRANSLRLFVSDAAVSLPLLPEHQGVCRGYQVQGGENVSLPRTESTQSYL